MNIRNHKSALLQPGQGRKLIIIGQEITIKLSSTETGGDYFLFESVTPPAGRVPLHAHSREDEILELIEGELEISLGGKTFKSTAGAIAFFPRNVAHGFSNPGTTPARARFLVSPGANFEKFFEELAALPANQPPDMPRIMEIFDRYGLPIVGGAPS